MIKRRARVTPELFREALKGTGGRKTEIAKKLGIAYWRVGEILQNREGHEWDKVRKAYEVEENAILDVAEKRIGELITQKDDLGEAGRNARWVLEKKRSGVYGEKKTVTVEGGLSPLKVQSSQVDLEKLPVEVRRSLLEAMEAGDSPSTSQGNPTAPSPKKEEDASPAAKAACLLMSPGSGAPPKGKKSKKEKSK